MHRRAKGRGVGLRDPGHGRLATRPSDPQVRHDRRRRRPLDASDDVHAQRKEGHLAEVSLVALSRFVALILEEVGPKRVLTIITTASARLGRWRWRERAEWWWGRGRGVDGVWRGHSGGGAGSSGRAGLMDARPPMGRDGKRQIVGGQVEHKGGPTLPALPWTRGRCSCL